MQGCHCELCLEANAAYAQDLRAANPAERAKANGQVTASMRKMAASGALSCRCGGHLAEAAGVVYCLACGV